MADHDSEEASQDTDAEQTWDDTVRAVFAGKYKFRFHNKTDHLVCLQVKNYMEKMTETNKTTIQGQVGVSAPLGPVPLEVGVKTKVKNVNEKYYEYQGAGYCSIDIRPNCPHQHVAENSKIIIDAAFVLDNLSTWKLLHHQKHIQCGTALKFLPRHLEVCKAEPIKGKYRDLAAALRASDTTLLTISEDAEGEERDTQEEGPWDFFLLGVNERYDGFYRRGETNFNENPTWFCKNKPFYWSGKRWCLTHRAISKGMTHNCKCSQAVWNGEMPYDELDWGVKKNNSLEPDPRILFLCTTPLKIQGMGKGPNGANGVYYANEERLHNQYPFWEKHTPQETHTIYWDGDKYHWKLTNRQLATNMHRFLYLSMPFSDDTETYWPDVYWGKVRNGTFVTDADMCCTWYEPPEAEAGSHKKKMKRLPSSKKDPKENKQQSGPGKVHHTSEQKVCCAFACSIQ